MACDILPGGVAVGRSFESMRMGAKEVSERWLKASRALKKEEQLHKRKSAFIDLSIDKATKSYQ